MASFVAPEGLMTDRSSSPQDAFVSRRGRRVHPARATEAELRAMLDRAAGAADGQALLRSAPLECAAILLGVEARLLERVRVTLDRPEPGDELAAVLGAGPSRRRPAADPPSPRTLVRDPHQLIDAARRQADGLDVLLSAAPEAAAIAFGVHPDLVHGAREVVAGRDRSEAR
jgi:hypothetical protein